MSTQTSFEKVGELRPKWGWFLALGIALLLLGAVALIVPWLTTLTSVLVFGWLLVFGGARVGVAAAGEYLGVRQRPRGFRRAVKPNVATQACVLAFWALHFSRV
ncbi:MAG TPA: DUF308 domain-containing protein [Thermoanaerobaculaceae bacterium]|nr:DUF308 domain-containing protein [Thermoanaerobaculaceae bacterium]